MDDLLIALLAQAPTPTDAALLTGFPSVDLFSRYRLPASGGLYFVLERDAILYIGKTVSFRQRWQGHHRLRQLPWHAWLYVQPCPGWRASELRRYERWLIRRLRPRLNYTRRRPWWRVW